MHSLAAVQFFSCRNQSSDDCKVWTDPPTPCSRPHTQKECDMVLIRISTQMAFEPVPGSIHIGPDLVYCGSSTDPTTDRWKKGPFPRLDNWAPMPAGMSWTSRCPQSIYCTVHLRYWCAQDQVCAGVHCYVCINIYVDMFVDLCVLICADMCVDMCVDLCVVICV